MTQPVVAASRAVESIQDGAAHIPSPTVRALSALPRGSRLSSGQKLGVCAPILTQVKMESPSERFISTKLTLPADCRGLG